MNTIKKYFEMDFFNSLTKDYFLNNNLIIIILNFNDGDVLKNPKIFGNNNKYFFSVELWDSGKPVLFRAKCIYSKVYILQIEKY
jgi:hypothetical protein